MGRRGGDGGGAGGLRTCTQAKIFIFKHVFDVYHEIFKEIKREKFTFVRSCFTYCIYIIQEVCSVDNRKF